MPYSKVDDHGKCPESKPIAVVKDSDGAVMGCHASDKSANDQIAALYAAEDKESNQMSNIKAISLDELRDNIYSALRETLGSMYEVATPSTDWWIQEVWTDHVIVEINEDHFKVPFSFLEGEVTLAPFDAWTEVERVWEAKDVTERLWVKGEKEEPIEETANETIERILREGFDDLKSILGRVNPANLDEKEIYYTFKGLDGRDWLLTWTTNAFKDREGEIFSTKSIEDYIDRHVSDESKGEFRFWHIPGSKFGEIKFQGMSGRFLIEAGPFDDTPYGQAMKDFLEQNPEGHPAIAPNGWGASHGYEYEVKDREDGVYDWFEKFETSILPVDVASNPYNPSMEVLKVKPEQMDALRAIAGDDEAQKIVERGDALSAELEGKVEHKEVESPPAEEPAPLEEPKAEPEPTAEPVAEPVVEPVAPAAEPIAPAEASAESVKAELDLLRTEISEALKILAGAQQEVAKIVLELAKDDAQKISEIVESTPRASLADVVKSVIGKEEVRVDGRTKEAKAGPTETPPVEIESKTGIDVIDKLMHMNRTQFADLQQ